MANSAMGTGRISIRLQRRDWWKPRPTDFADRGNIMPLRKGSGQSVVSSNRKWFGKPEKNPWMHIKVTDCSKNVR